MKLEHIVVKAVCPSGSVSVRKGGRVRGLGLGHVFLLVRAIQRSLSLTF